MLFFFNDTATTEIYTLSLHDALPISPPGRLHPTSARRPRRAPRRGAPGRGTAWGDRPEVSQPQEPNFQTPRIDRSAPGRPRVDEARRLDPCRGLPLVGGFSPAKHPDCEADIIE